MNIIKKEYNHIYIVWKDYKMPNYLPTKEKFERMIKKYFKIAAVKYGTDWFKEFCPVYVLKSK